MKKVLITESDIRRMVRKMLMEQTTMGSTPVGSTGFAPQGTNLTTSAAKQSTTVATTKNKALSSTLTQVDTRQELLGQFMNILQNVNEKLKPGVMSKQSLVTDFTKLVTDLGYK
jgi:hypothetical protein